MLTTIRPVQFNAGVCSGKTKPSRVTCEKPDGDLLEAVAKFSAGCEGGVISLAMEVVCACLAGDLNLQVPQPYLIDVDPEWVAIVPDDERRRVMEASSRIAFGSTLMTPAFSVWSDGSRVTPGMMPTALAVFVFDCAINNFDRCAGNPNCLVKGDMIWIIDHELAFRTKGILGWQPPWELGALRPFETPGRHIFRAGLKGEKHDYNPIRAAWAGLSDSRLKQYERAIPPEWGIAKAAVDDALDLIRDVRDNIDGCLKEVGRVLA